MGVSDIFFGISRKFGKNVLAAFHIAVLAIAPCTESFDARMFFNPTKATASL
jgi:hypothetical protein